MIKAGDRIATWFSGCDDGMSTVLAVKSYRGKYPQHFDCVLTVTAPRTNARSIEMAFDSNEVTA